MSEMLCEHGPAADCKYPRCQFAYAVTVKNFDRLEALCQRLYRFAEHTKEVMGQCYDWVNFSAGVDWNSLGYDTNAKLDERFRKLHRDVNDFEHFDEDLFYDL